MEQLKPCPFCGEMPDIETWYEPGFGRMEPLTMIRCVGNDCIVHPSTKFQMESVAIEAWNRRV